jgi:hypothetical protein
MALVMTNRFLNMLFFAIIACSYSAPHAQTPLKIGEHSQKQKKRVGWRCPMPITRLKQNLHSALEASTPSARKAADRKIVPCDFPETILSLFVHRSTVPF